MANFRGKPMSSPYKLHLHRWANTVKCNLPMLMTCQDIAAKSRDLFDVVKKFREGALEARLPKFPETQEWLRLYSNPGQVIKVVAEKILHVKDGDELVRSMRLAHRLPTTIRKEPEQIKDAVKAMGFKKIWKLIRLGLRTAPRVYRRHLEELYLEMQDKGGNSADDFGELIASHPEMLFYGRVALPCLVLYQTLPLTLLRQASRGSPNKKAIAIERLVRLDPKMVHHPIVEDWVNSPSGDVRADRQKMVAKWLYEQLDTGRFTWIGWLTTLAGCLQAHIEVAGGYLTFPKWELTKGKIEAEQMRKLFMAAEEDRARLQGREPELDWALDRQSETWRKQVAKQRKLWLQVVRVAPGTEQSFATGAGTKSR